LIYAKRRRRAISRLFHLASQSIRRDANPFATSTPKSIHSFAPMRLTRDQGVDIGQAKNQAVGSHWPSGVSAGKTQTRGATSSIWAAF